MQSLCGRSDSLLGGRILVRRQLGFAEAGGDGLRRLRRIICFCSRNPQYWESNHVCDPHFQGQTERGGAPTRAPRRAPGGASRRARGDEGPRATGHQREEGRRDCGAGYRARDHRILGKSKLIAVPESPRRLHSGTGTIGTRRNRSGWLPTSPAPHLLLLSSHSVSGE